MATKKPKSKLPIKKSTTKKSKLLKTNKYQTFKLQKNQEPFLSLNLTLQTLYWAILILFVAGLSVWIIILQIRINSLYDTVQENISTSSQIDELNQKIQENKKAIEKNKAAIKSSNT